MVCLQLYHFRVQLGECAEYHSIVCPPLYENSSFSWKNSKSGRQLFGLVLAGVKCMDRVPFLYMAFHKPWGPFHVGLANTGRGENFMIHAHYASLTFYYRGLHRPLHSRKSHECMNVPYPDPRFGYDWETAFQHHGQYYSSTSKFLPLILRA